MCKDPDHVVSLAVSVEGRLLTRRKEVDFSVADCESEEETVERVGEFAILLVDDFGFNKHSKVWIEIRQDCKNCGRPLFDPMRCLIKYGEILKASQGLGVSIHEAVAAIIVSIYMAASTETTDDSYDPYTGPVFSAN